MPDRPRQIQRSVEKARKQWERVLAGQQRALLTAYTAVADNITASLIKGTKEGAIPPGRLTTLTGVVQTQMKQLRADIRKTVRQGMNQSIDMGLEAGVETMSGVDTPQGVKVQVGSSFIGAAGEVRKFNAAQQTFTSSKWGQLHRASMEHLLKHRPAGIPLTQSVWDVTWQTEKAVRNRVNAGILRGEPAARVARDIQIHLKEPSRLFRRVRRDGRLVLSRAARQFNPGAGVYRSSFKNAMRLVRSEMNRAYFQGQIAYMDDKKWIDGAIWRLGGPNPCEICIGRDGTFYPKDEIPMQPHPQCQCWLEWHIQGDEKPESGPVEPDAIPA